MKRTTIALALLSAVMFTIDASADRPDKPDGKRGEQGQRRAGDAGQGRPGGPGAAQGDPAEMVARMLKEFDKDGDQKLDLAELTAMMKSMRERRGQLAGQRGAGQGRSRPGGPDGDQAGERRRPGGPDGQARKGKGRPDGQGKPGGDKPKRPDAE